MSRAQILAVIVIFVMIAAVVGIFLFIKFRPSEDASKNNSGIPQENASVNESQNNQSINNQSQNNQSTPNQVVLVPPEITGISLREENGGYFCNKSLNPKHQVRLYTYKIIDGVKVLSENYTESKEIRDVCKSYPDINLSKEGINYNIRWEWKAVEGIEGYRIYQYCRIEEKNITRNYDYYIELNSLATKLIDNGLNLWRKYA